MVVKALVAGLAAVVRGKGLMVAWEGVVMVERAGARAVARAVARSVEGVLLAMAEDAVEGADTVAALLAHGVVREVAWQAEEVTAAAGGSEEVVTDAVAKQVAVRQEAAATEAAAQGAVAAEADTLGSVAMVAVTLVAVTMVAEA